MTQLSSVFEQGTLVQFNVSIWTGKVKLLSEQVQTEADPDYIRGSKLLIDRRSLRPIEQERNVAKRFLRSHSLPFPISGVCFIPRTLVPRTEEVLQTHRLEFERQVELFAAQYESAKFHARLRLNTLFDEADYPENILEKFSFEWRFFVMDAPGRLSILDPEIYDREQARFQQRMEEFRENAVLVLRERFSEMVDRVVDRLSGENKVFRNSTIGNIQDFLTSFEALNISSDHDLAREVDRCREILAGVDPNALRSDESYKAHIAKKMTEVQSELTQMMTERPRRTVWMDIIEEEEENGDSAPAAA